MHINLAEDLLSTKWKRFICNLEDVALLIKYHLSRVSIFDKMNTKFFIWTMLLCLGHDYTTDSAKENFTSCSAKLTHIQTRYVYMSQFSLCVCYRVWTLNTACDLFHIGGKLFYMWEENHLRRKWRFHIKMFHNLS